MTNESGLISDEDLKKALDTLGISLTTNEDTLQKSVEDSKEDKEEDKKIGGEENESTKDQKVEGKKDEKEESDDEIEKAYEKSAKELAELEKACGMKKSEVEEMSKKRKKLPDEPLEKSQSDELVKAEFNALGSKVDAVTLLFKKTITENNELRKALNSTLEGMRSQTAQVDQLQKVVIEMGNQSLGRKSVITSKAIEKSFSGDLGNDGKKVLSLSRDKVEIESTLLDFSNIEKGEGSDINMSYANAATLYNTSRTLDRATINDLASKNIKIVE